MFTISKSFIRVGEDLFLVLRAYAEDKILNVDLVKQWLGANAVYKRDGVLYFCDKVEELEILN